MWYLEGKQTVAGTFKGGRVPWGKAVVVQGARVKQGRRSCSCRETTLQVPVEIAVEVLVICLALLGLAS